MRTQDVRANEDDRLISRETWQWPDDFGSYDHDIDDDGDGSPESADGHRFDAEGRLGEEWEDEGADGWLELEGTIEYHPDGHGPTVEIYTLRTPDQPPATSTYTHEGRLAAVTVDMVFVDVASTFSELYTWICP